MSHKRKPQKSGVTMLVQATGWLEIVLDEKYADEAKALEYMRKTLGSQGCIRKYFDWNNAIIAGVMDNKTGTMNFKNGNVITAYTDYMKTFIDGQKKKFEQEIEALKEA